MRYLWDFQVSSQLTSFVLSCLQLFYRRWKIAKCKNCPNHESECHAHGVISNQSFALAVFKFHLSLNFVPATFLVRYYLVWLWFRGLSLHQFSLSTIDDRILHKKKAVAVLTRSCRSELTCLFLLFYFQCLWLDSHSVYGKPWLGLLFRF